jgi:drug/metabolite transporter (DMT)-like permease
MGRDGSPALELPRIVHRDRWSRAVRLRADRWPAHRHSAPSAFNTTVWHLCSAYGLMLMASGRAAIIAFTMPLWATLLAVPLLGERITRAKAAGLALGLAGLSCLLVGEASAIGAAPLGGLLMLGAAVAWAVCRS